MYIELSTQNESSVICDPRLVQFLTLIRCNQVHTLPPIAKVEKDAKEALQLFPYPMVPGDVGKVLSSASATHKPESAVQNAGGTWLAPESPKPPGQLGSNSVQQMWVTAGASAGQPVQAAEWPQTCTARQEPHCMWGTNPLLAPLNPAVLSVTRLG